MATTAMNTDQFWDIIANTTAAFLDPDDQIDALSKALQNLPLPEIVTFEQTFRKYLNEAYRWDLWGAAYVIHGGCSDDGFEYFRRWLVTRGRGIYESALADPDSLAEVNPAVGPDGVWEFEEIYYVIGDAYSTAGGQDDVRDHSEMEAGLDGRPPAGAPFEESEGDLSQRYPKLWARFGSRPLG